MIFCLPHCYHYQSGGKVFWLRRMPKNTETETVNEIYRRLLWLMVKFEKKEVLVRNFLKSKKLTDYYEHLGYAIDCFQIQTAQSSIRLLQEWEVLTLRYEKKIKWLRIISSIAMVIVLVVFYIDFILSLKHKTSSLVYCLLAGFFAFFTPILLSKAVSKISFYMQKRDSFNFLDEQESRMNVISFERKGVRKKNS